jgi:exodeoxyribonuclease VII small subunit
MPSEPTDTTDDLDDLDDLGYAEAVDELEEILHELDSDDVDVDLLAERVKRAADLVQLCRRRLDAARVEVTRIVADLEAVAPLADGAPGDGSGEGDDVGPGGLFAAEG